MSISLDEYLNTSYQDGDREYVDGEVIERNLGEVAHAFCLTAALCYLHAHYRQMWQAVSVRIRVSSNRIRVPDVTVVVGPRPEGKFISSPPLLVIEVLSPDDRAEDVQEKIDDYLSFGIPFVWVVNPRTKRGYVYTVDGMREAKDGVLRTNDPEIALPLGEIF